MFGFCRILGLVLDGRFEDCIEFGNFRGFFVLDICIYSGL
jgi:hypothetical protein